MLINNGAEEGEKGLHVHHSKAELCHDRLHGGMRGVDSKHLNATSDCVMTVFIAGSGVLTVNILMLPQTVS